MEATVIKVEKHRVQYRYGEYATSYNVWYDNGYVENTHIERKVGDKVELPYYAKPPITLFEEQQDFRKLIDEFILFK